MQAVTAGRYGSQQATTPGKLSFPLYSVKLYETRARQSDGAVTWRFVRHISKGHTWAPTVERWAEAEAEARGLSYEHGLIHGVVETPAPAKPARLANILG